MVSGSRAIVFKSSITVIDTWLTSPYELQALADGCNLLVLSTTPDALAIDALLQTLDLLMSLGSDRYRILLTMVHPKPVNIAQQARAALSEFPLFDPEIRRLITYEEASLMGVLVYQVKELHKICDCVAPRFVRPRRGRRAALTSTHFVYADHKMTVLRIKESESE